MFIPSEGNLENCMVVDYSAECSSTDEFPFVSEHPWEDVFILQETLLATFRRNEELQHALEQSKEIIRSLQEQLAATRKECSEPLGATNANIESDTQNSRLNRLAQQQEPSISRSTDPVGEIQRWLFMEGGFLLDVPEMLTKYSEYVRNVVGISLDRVFVGALMLHPDVSAYVWKWEHGVDFDGHEIPRDIFAKKKELFSPDEPFIVLMEGRAQSIRMKVTDKKIPKDCQWFRDNNYQDYLALPLVYQQQFVGAIAWSTKNPAGFSDNHIEFFKKSLEAFTTVLRLHTSDLVMSTLTGRLEYQVQERTAELAEANQKIMAHSAAQLKHFAMMSHEIRTPLNCIIGMSSLLVDSKLSECQRESLRMITTSGDLLVNVVNDVLDYSRLESGNLEIQVEPTNIRSVVDVVLHSMNVKCRSRCLIIESQLDDDIPKVVETDGNRLQQILYNLFGNAAKFSNTGGRIHFTMKLVDLGITNGKSKRVLRFTIRDHGKGIASCDRQRIFEPFNQGSDNTGRKYGGTGLGLAITSKLVKGLGGAISVESEPGKFTKFIVDLPCVETQPSQSSQRSDSVISRTHSLRSLSGSCHGVTPRQKEESKEDYALLSSPQLPEEKCPTRRPQACVQSNSQRLLNGETNIMVVDDNSINRKLLVRMLKRIGAESIATAEDGVQAVDLADSREFDMIFMDVEMPRMDGIEATRRILANAKERQLNAPKILFVTAHALDTFHSQAVEAGGSAFVTKPFSLGKMCSVLASM